MWTHLVCINHLNMEQIWTLIILYLQVQNLPIIAPKYFTYVWTFSSISFTKMHTVLKSDSVIKNQYLETLNKPWKPPCASLTWNLFISHWIQFCLCARLIRGVFTHLQSPVWLIYMYICNGQSLGSAGSLSCKSLPWHGNSVLKVI